MAYAGGFNANFTLHAFGGTLTGFIALYALALNLAVSALLTLSSQARHDVSNRIDPEGWPRPSGYSNGVLAEGRFLAIAGQIGWNERDELVSAGFLEQASQALRNVVAVLRAAGGEPGASRAAHLVRYQ